jgi:hypothetical protein
VELNVTGILPNADSSRNMLQPDRVDTEEMVNFENTLFPNGKDENEMDNPKDMYPQVSTSSS